MYLASFYVMAGQASPWTVGQMDGMRQVKPEIWMTDVIIRGECQLCKISPSSYDSSAVVFCTWACAIQSVSTCHFHFVLAVKGLTTLRALKVILGDDCLVCPQRNADKEANGTWQWKMGVLGTKLQMIVSC